MSLLGRIFTWWNGYTVGTWLDTRRHGVLVGQDAEGNRFFQSADGRRRWVLYEGETEASRVSPDWHGWLHHTFAEPPSQRPLPKKPWEKPHLPNLTGTAAAYAPPGAVSAAAARLRAGGDYEAWAPE
jgi:NADH:ubiquinone oxidoreductase subunit